MRIESQHLGRSLHFEVKRVPTKSYLEKSFALMEAFPKRLPDKNFIEMSGRHFDHRKMPHARVAVVGTRRPTPYGRRFVCELFDVLRAFDLSIVSGGALGVDSLAHKEALLHKIPQLCVLVGPSNNPSPASNQGIFENIIAQNGALLFPELLSCSDGQSPRPSFWLQRNQWIAAISDLVIVVEATTRSGTFSTAKAACEFSKEVLLLPGPIFSESSHGVHRLINQGTGQVIENLDFVEKYLYDMAIGRAHDPAKVSGYNLSESQKTICRIIFKNDAHLKLGQLCELLPNCQDDLQCLITQQLLYLRLDEVHLNCAQSHFN